VTGPPASDRFRKLDAYRAHREWARYEGTPQRDLFRELRERFLERHASLGGWVLDVGSGPGRFLPFLGPQGAHRVALDVSREMLGLIPGAWAATGREDPLPDRVLGDATRPPLEPGRWSEVVVLGNTLGFSVSAADQILESMLELVAPGGELVVEIAPSAGERSRYLGRLPPSGVGRLLRSPVRAILARLDREGFEAETLRHDAGDSFRRISSREIHHRFERAGWQVTEEVAVAPSLGPDAIRIAAVRPDAKAWGHLLELEETVGRRPERHEHAAALLVAARRPSSTSMIK